MQRLIPLPILEHWAPTIPQEYLQRLLMGIHGSIMQRRGAHRFHAVRVCTFGKESFHRLLDAHRLLLEFDPTESSVYGRLLPPERFKLRAAPCLSSKPITSM